MKAKVVVTVDIDKDDSKYCGTNCAYGNFVGNLCTLRGENFGAAWLNIEKGKSKRTVYCRKREVQ